MRKIRAEPSNADYWGNRLGVDSANIWSLKGSVLIIAEKPKAANKISESLSLKYQVRKFYGVPYYEIKANELTLIVASAVGHLYELRTRSRSYPVFDYEWVPAYIASRGKTYTRRYLQALSSLFKKCSYYVNACDYDIEGSVIGYLLIKFHGNEERAFRVKFSSLVSSELKAAFNKLSPLDYNMIEAGLCRHELDWIWGINISRALMSSVYKASSKKIPLSAGRVQTPTLKYLAKNDLERKLFIPLPQYTLSVTLQKNNRQFTAELSINPILKEIEAKNIKDHVEKFEYLVVEGFTLSRQRYRPLPPFSLSDLQEEASRVYGISPMRTQRIAEQLYLDALISYPRTNSQKLPPTLNYREILDKLAKQGKYYSLVKQLLVETRDSLKPIEGEREDPAHPAIYPTGVLPRKLTREQYVIYDLIVRRFLASFAQPAVVLNAKISLTTPDAKYWFETTGLMVEYKGWMAYYPFRSPSTRPIPEVERGDRVEVVEVNVRESYTKPKPKLRKIDVLKWMEGVNIGTESTRALIIEKLFERGYAKSTKSGIEITELGAGIADVIESFFPDLTSVE
ncbi:MAG: DNA topoisomerase I, partial [Desulfurococcaceae archaeon]